ncbi:hypothetical protein LOK49_LG05G02592 [Camellia lanceoleosa]|uniref:Uncharacterized protein n=1 Tax=Camellia lanceoleosa TaxID=1840588 RepID=A0ACC0HMM0_9ERIC|nr:hypothetical protein LOK49_LG05G02592 [Camellia lanceoleosa]
MAVNVVGTQVVVVKGSSTRGNMAVASKKIRQENKVFGNYLSILVLRFKRKWVEDCSFSRAKAILGCTGPKLVACICFSLATDLCLVRLNTVSSATKAFHFYWHTIKSLECLPLAMSAECLLD